MSDECNAHDYAMEAAFFADQERKAGNEKKAAPLFEQALQLELQALAATEKSEGLWWSILHRSAGWLALDCGQPRLAEKLGLRRSGRRSGSGYGRSTAGSVDGRP